MKYSTSAKLHSRTGKDGKRAIYVTYTYDKQTTPFSTAYSVTEECWDSKKKLAKIGCFDGARINAKIQQTQEILLDIASKLATPTHALVKKLYTERGYQASKAELNSFLDLAIAIGEDEQIVQAEQRLNKEHQQLQHRKQVHAPAAKKHGLESLEQQALRKAEQQLKDLFLEYAGTGDIIPGQVDRDGKPRRDQGTLVHHKPDTYLHMRAMWSQLQEFSEYTGYVLTLDSINLNFYTKFGNYVLFDRVIKNKAGQDMVIPGCYDNHFGSLIKRLKSFLSWCRDDKGLAVNAQVKSKKFKTYTEVNEVIILSDAQYKLLADFRNEPECRESWLKAIDLTLFQTAVGLRHSDLKRATWRVTGEIVEGKDRRKIVGTTQKNKSAYAVPVFLNEEWSLGILEKYNYDFSDPVESAKKRGAKGTISNVLMNRTMRHVLEALNEKHNLFPHKIPVFKKKWGADYKVGDFYQYELHTTHDNRRAFITRMFRRKYTEKQIASMVGTSSLPELRKYQQVTDEDIFVD